jgi:hypothetical protein
VVTARLCWTYPMLLISSFLAMDQVVWQRLLVSMWLAYVLLLFVQSARRGLSMRRAVAASAALNFPGMVMAGASVCSLWAPSAGGWAPGALEFWLHPFIPLLELLPPGTMAGTSDLYDVVCLLPFLLLGVTVGVWFLTFQLAHNDAGRSSRASGDDGY